MTSDERATLGCSLIAALYTTFPLHHGPAFEAVLREFGKDSGEIDLPIAERAEAPCPFDPGLVAAVDTLPARPANCRVLHMEHFDAIVIEIDKLQIVELLQNKMAGIEQHVTSGMVLDPFQEHLEGD